MAENRQLEQISCPCCGAHERSNWASERGFILVRCKGCRLLYVNPRPPMSQIDEGVRLGEHHLNGKTIDVRARRISRKVSLYRNVIERLFRERITQAEPIAWVDYGAGYGEIIEAASAVLPEGSQIIGVEPMGYKAESARSRGLDVRDGYPQSSQFQADVISMVNIFSHIPDFREILQIAASNLKPGGELFIETGNLADLENRKEFPGILDLPDHLVFSGEQQMERFLRESGFQILRIERQRVDRLSSFIKELAKRLLGRPVILRAPYSSAYRQLMIRARLKTG